MEKISGRFYVSTLILTAMAEAGSKAIEGTWYYWFVVMIHLLCLVFVIIGGVE